MSLAKRIDYTNIRPNATIRDIELLCREALTLNVRAVCVNPCYVSYAKRILKDEILVCAAIDVPFGSSKIDVKKVAVKETVIDGADEVDYVVNIGMLKSGRLDYLIREAQEIVEAADGRIVKAIIEVGYLTKDEVVAAAINLADVGVQYIKTCSGYGPRGVTVEDVLLLRGVLMGRARIKAAGGIRDRHTAQTLIDAGADIIGTSAAKQILTGLL